MTRPKDGLQHRLREQDHLSEVNLRGPDRLIAHPPASPSPTSCPILLHPLVLIRR